MREKNQRCFICFRKCKTCPSDGLIWCLHTGLYWQYHLGCNAKWPWIFPVLSSSRLRAQLSHHICYGDILSTLMLLQGHKQLPAGQSDCTVSISQRRDKSLHQRKKLVIWNEQLQLMHYRVSITPPPSPCLPKKGQGFFSSLLSASTLPTTERPPVQLRLLSCMHFNEGMCDGLRVPLHSTISARSFCGCMCCTAGKANCFQGSQNM